MKLYFTLRENVNANSSTDGLTVVHRLKNPALLKFLSDDQRSDMNRLWEIDKKKNLKLFTSKILEHFEMEEKFGLIIPPTHRDQFTRPLREHLINHFPNAIDLSDFFSKDDGVSFGTDPYSNMTIEALSHYVHLDNEVDLTNITKILIADDVYSQGKTFDVIEAIINKHNQEIELISGTLIKTN